MLDLNTVDSITQASIVDTQSQSFIDYNELDELNDKIKAQYIDFENMGRNLLEGVEIKYMLPIYEDMLDFVIDSYLAITNQDDAMMVVEKRIEIGRRVYQFLCVDMYNTILPNYLTQINCISLEQFDLYFRSTLKGDASNFKTGIVKTIKRIVDELMKLQILDKNISTDKHYQSLVKRYGYYLEIVNYGDSNNFLFNFVRPMFMKNMEDIIWRT